MLYLEHFGLDEPPFRITPHTDFFFDGADRGATLDALLYAILQDEGIVKVSGEVGSGKTMLCRVLMERLPEHVEIVYLANPSLARDEILHAIADDLGVEFSQGRITVVLRNLLDCLIEMYADNRRVVVLIDEAHAMPEETLEQVRLLSNLESNQHKLLQIVLFGQPELDELLDKSSMRQLKDRITHSFRMRPLSEQEVGKYLSFRMRAAGYRGPDVFSPKAISMISKAASGLTRRVNILADKALLAAFTVDTHAISGREARTAIRDSEFGRLLNENRRHPALFAAAALFVGLALGAGIHWTLSRDQAGAPPNDGGSGNRRAPPAASAPSPASASPSPVSADSAATPSSEGKIATWPPTSSLPPPEPVTAATSVPIAGPLGARAPGDEAGTPITSPAAAQKPLLSAEIVRRVSAYRVGSNRLLKQRVAATMERMAREPDRSYSIELYSTDNSDPARMERFLQRANDLINLEDIYVLPQVSGEKYRIRVTFGAYPDRAAAAKAIELLPPKYKQAFQTELRSFAELREAI